MKAVALYREISNRKTQLLQHRAAANEAIRLAPAGQLIDIEVATPTPEPHDLLVRVVATAINPIDCRLRADAIEAPGISRILGWDGAGVVEAVGSAVTLFAPGDRVYYAGAIERPGSNAELQLVDERLAGQMPQSLLFGEAAALPLSAITAWEVLFNRLHIDCEGSDRGRRLLIIGGAGGVGSIATQLAEKLGRLEVIATASRPASRLWCRRNGADHVVDHGADLVAQLQELDIFDVDYIACFGNLDEHLPAMLRLIKSRGTMISTVEHLAPLPLAQLQCSNATLGWEFPLTNRHPDTLRGRRHHRILNRVAAWIDSDRLATTATTELRGINAASLRSAHTLQESGKVAGKIVVSGFC